MIGSHHSRAIAFRLITPALCLCVLAAGVAAAPAIEVERTAGGGIARAEHFALEWSSAQGGDITSIQLHDGRVWHEVLGSTAVRPSMPGMRIVGPDTDLRSRGAASVEWIEEGPDRAVVRFVSLLTTVEGEASALSLTQTYTVYPEGAIFVDFELELPAGADSIVVERASLGMPTRLELYDLQRWHWRRTASRGDRFLEVERTFKNIYLANTGVALGFGNEFTNQIQFGLERGSLLGDPTEQMRFVLSEDLYFLYHLRPREAGPVTLTAPFRYTNRLDLFLGRQVRRDPLIGARLVYWQEGVAGGMAYPSPSALEAMVDCGASGVVLGPGWQRLDAPGDHVPLDAEAMRAMISTAHSMGLDVVPSIVAGGDAGAIASWIAEHDLDGVFVDKASAHYGLIADPGWDFPGRATFEWTRALRRGLDDDALVLADDGVEGPDLTANLTLPGVVFGTGDGEHKAGRNPVNAAYLGGQGYGVPCPLPIPLPLRDGRALAAYAASGAMPLAPLGNGMARSAYSNARWVLPLWQIYRVIEPDSESYGRSSRTFTSTSPRFGTRLYKGADDRTVIVTANLHQARTDTATFAIDYQSLGMQGEYSVEELRALDIESFESIYLGRSSDGLIHTALVPPHGVRGFLLAGGDYPPMLGLALDQISRLGRAYGDTRPPTPPAPPQVTALPGLMRIEWEAATDDHHVEAYRVYRSPTAEIVAETLSELGVFYETTHAIDTTVAPGVEAHYAVSAIDQAGNEGYASPMVGARQPTSDTVLTFDDASQFEGLELISGTWSHADTALCHSCTPDGTRFAQAMLTDVRGVDFDLRALIDSPGGYHYAGGLSFRADDAGNGYVVYLGGIDHAWLKLAALEDEVVRPITEAHCPYMAPGRTAHVLEVTARGDTFVFSVDGQEVMRVEDTSFAGDRLGFASVRGRVTYENVVFQSHDTGRP